MNVHELVDELYEAFAEGLGSTGAAHARELPHTLHLAPRGVPWSQVFSHEVTLGAPALFAEPMGVPNGFVRDAVLAHLLAVIEAFGTDRVEDQQVVASPELLGVLERARRERDRALSRLLGGPPPPELGYAVADETSLRAIRRERALQLAARPVDLATYESVSLDKQAPGLVASVALARVAGWDERRCRAVRGTLESVALGLQAYDDVVDWESDLDRGGSWAVCLMKHASREGRAKPPTSETRMKSATSERPTESARIRLHVLQSGVLLALMRRAAVHMRAARRRAHVLGAESLSAWAAGRAARLAALSTAEAANAGYTVRAHALSAWAGEVLA
jgi:hypothetical protein